MPCANCKLRTCFTGVGEMPARCPERNREKYRSQQSINGLSDSVLNSCEKKKDRLNELIEYANFMGYKKIGLAGCIGLHDELRVINNLLKNSGLEVVSMMCKSGHLEKKTIGVPSTQRLTTKTGYSIGVVACNPVAQALLFNKIKTDLNCIIGLCVGHDSIFMKHSKAPVVTLIAKDRSNAHNPASILYCFYGDNFFKRRPSPEGASKFNLKHIKPIDVFRIIRNKIRS